jgi:hypothetical protein
MHSALGALGQVRLGLAMAERERPPAFAAE